MAITDYWFTYPLKKQKLQRHRQLEFIFKMKTG